MPHRRFSRILLAALLVAGLFLPSVVVAGEPPTPAAATVNWLLDGSHSIRTGVANLFDDSEVGPTIDPNGDQVQPSDTTSSTTDSSPPDGGTEVGPTIDPDG